MKEYDIVIIGGGFVGASALLGLSRLAPHLKIALIDAAGPSKASGGERSIVLSYASQRIFTQWGYWEHLSQDSVPLRAVHISQAGQFGRIKIKAETQGVPALGYVITADKLTAFLKEQVKSSHYFYHTKCISLARQGESTQLKIEKIEGESYIQQHWLAKLVLVADGAHSKIRELLGIPIDEIQYTHQALVTQVQVTRPNQTAYERFIEDETLAMVPRGGNFYGVIWKMSNQRMHELMNLSAQGFLTALTQCFGYRLGQISGGEVRKSYPLQFIRALKETLPGLVLLGDAAHANPPIAAQGLNLSLRDIAALVDNIEEAIRTNQDFASESLLQQYENQRLWDQASIISLINFPMTRTFRYTPEVLKGLLWLGVDLCTRSKRGFANRMMGL